MPFNKDIPGWMPDIDLETLEMLTSRVPKEGSIVEVGSYLGRSSWVLAKSCHPSVKVTCIDLWDDEWIRKDSSNTLTPLMSTFLENTKECPNIQAIQSGSTEVDWPENQKVDLVFIDADHTSPQVDKDIEFWSKRVKPKGVLAGHDFQIEVWPDVCRAVIRLSEKLHLPFMMYGSGFVWWIDYDPSTYPKNAWIPNDVLVDNIKEAINMD